MTQATAGFLAFKGLLPPMLCNLKNKYHLDLLKILVDKVTLKMK